MANLEFNPIEKTLDLVGNGGGGGGAERLIVNVTYETGIGYSADKTFAEIAAAVAGNKIVTVRSQSLEYVFSHTVIGSSGSASKHYFYQSSTDTINYLNILDDESVEVFVLEPATAANLNAKADKMQRVTTIPSDGGYNPNCLYVLTLDSTARTISLNAAAAGLAAEYHIFLIIGATAPTITWPQGLKWKGGTAPTIEANHEYEINIVEGKAYAEDWGAAA